MGLLIFQLAQTVAVAYGFAEMTRPILKGIPAVTHEATLLAVFDLIETLALDRFAKNTITICAAFRTKIDSVRTRGYAVTAEEHDVGIRAISVPIFVNQKVVAAVATTAPAFRTSIDQLVRTCPNSKKRLGHFPR